MSIHSWRYVEMTYNLPDGGSHFHAVVTEADSPDAAVQEGRKSVLHYHPNATGVVEFLSRTITPERAREIQQQFADETWEGWPLG